jgi:hypothetical protein
VGLLLNQHPGEVMDKADHSTHLHQFLRAHLKLNPADLQTTIVRMLADLGMSSSWVRVVGRNHSERGVWVLFMTAEIIHLDPNVAR